MLKKAAQKLLKAPQNLPHLGTPKIYQKCIFGNLGGQEHRQNGALLGYILCPKMAQAEGSDFGSQIDFL